MAPLHEGVICPKADREGLFFSDFCGENHRPRRGRSAGPDFSPMRNRGKNRQRRGLPPPCGIHPAVRGGRLRSSLFGPWPSSCHIDGFSVYGLYLLLCWYNLLPSGPFPGMQLFPVAGGRAQKAPEHCRISCVVGCRGGACPSRIPQGNTREPTGRASHGPYRSATGWCSKTPGGGNAAWPG